MASGEITLLQINDVHGYMEPHPEMAEGDHTRLEILGGYARISRLFQKVRNERPGAVVALDNGDTFHGTYPVVKSKGAILLPMLNHLGLDAMTGHWDFAYGSSHLKELVSQLDYPMLAINCFDRQTGELTFAPTRVVERGGLRIGIIGIAATIIDKTMPPKFHEGIYLTLGRNELPHHIQRLRQEDGVDLVVVLSHLGFPQDVQLAKEIPGIDILLSGHTHNRLRLPVTVDETIIIQSGSHGSFVGRLDLVVRDGKVASHTHRLISIDNTVGTDLEMEKLIAQSLAPHREFLDRVVGATDICLARDRMFGTTMDNLLLDAIATAAGTELAFSNGWRYGAPVPTGPVTMNDLWNIIPTNPPVQTVELTGTELLAMLEENLERTFAANPYDQMGGYMKRCRGIDLYVKVENPPGCRVQRIFIAGAPLEPDRRYTAAFVTDQGVPAKFGMNRVELAITAIDAMCSYLERPIRQESHGSIVPA